MNVAVNYFELVHGRRSEAETAEGHLALNLNEAKSKAARLRECTFLGFRIYRGKLRWTDAAVQTFKQRVREITDRHNGKSMRSRLLALRRYQERLEATANPKAASAGPWHLERRRQTGLAQPEWILADGWKQYCPACPDTTVVMGSRCSAHAAAMG